MIAGGEGLFHAPCMDLTTFSQSALSTYAMVGHASYLLLILSMLMTRMMWLRALAVASGLLSITYSVMISDYVSATWEVLFVAVNVGQLSLQAYRNRNTHFSPEERRFREAVLPLVEPAQARRVLAIGRWCEAVADEVLIPQGEQASHMLFIASGEVAVSVNGNVVGWCGPGALSGELSVLTDMPATAAITAVQPTRYLALERHALRRLMAREPDIEHAIDQCFRNDMRLKLSAANEALAGAGVRVEVVQTSVR